jgi:hypothetical protein
MSCGISTDQTIRVKKKGRNSNYQPNSTSSLDNHPLAVFLNFIAGKYHQSVEVSVPLCSACKKIRLEEPRHIDFENRSMTFIGHRLWRDDIERERKSGTN